jgi:hypothetical protein
MVNVSRRGRIHARLAQKPPIMEGMLITTLDAGDEGPYTPRRGMSSEIFPHCIPAYWKQTFLPS